MSRSSPSGWWFPGSSSSGATFGESQARDAMPKVSYRKEEQRRRNPKLQQGVIEVSDISDAEGEESHMCIGYDDDVKFA